ncbi:Type I restriction-modification system, specificity subunit S [Streptococcus thermophilus]|uniref:restriction endonuclease subunit S n=1 Tax=Streptococcus thermophilus TaxID=1308 RepID=UPI0015C20EA9|nr:restriction endonuclease subunit S [Streptococcus thermophilus]CAD0147301.1 Type I restriction-modification system, specificity subunit S [Streptococcus thermophilus]CAD0150430.1 Type I restriction-modification system, specificity subunit S [Streptococcus thermophilus]
MTNSKYVPKRRFKEFELDDEWNLLKLDEVAKYRNGKAHEHSISLQGKFIVVNSKFISTNGEVKKFTDLQIEPIFKNEISFVLSDVPNGRAIARTFLIDQNDKYTLNQRIAAITPNSNISPYYLYVLLNRNKYFLEFDDGVKQTNLSKADVLEFKEYYPISKEQSMIGDFFQTIDSLISLHQHKLDKLKNLKKAYLSEMFPAEGERVPKRRFPGLDGEWEQNRLEEVAKFNKGKGYSKSDLQKKGSPIILYGRLYTKYETVISEVDTFTFIKENSVLSKGGEVLVPSSGESSEDISRASVVLNEGVILGGDLNIIKLQRKIEPVFLSLAISNGNQKKELSRRAQGKSVVHLNNDDLKQVSVLAPTENEQKKISNFFSVLDKLITLQQQKLDKLNDLKKAYLNELFV